ncbi:SRPBCC domain-containing protein [Leptospira sp. 2 VSF19]|uniref:SRPBCC domain-containing protein n=1 Tax=Leptospira soteropolitanensis TaxID=2950025 RepID=A0AAW5VHT9_9LEPT|nr:SRPBCC domain-containing protein [Leptospira soteropolitanensis]MCW7491220.1 SRPBCC domain-containing protein [Leptospira soteropolitanensis]MCW7498804.1 SRPBCC domain-containing protein [Leptospira soteropolitanensis]MCW7521603.1 SRPBCC domain-containing protein [Leptospira soteropolitanensis]MCW7524908.1 SRPBCC domain-containing protein [Leptospira soteropolitanensis]MCW7528775.1 SRPBCC domain-containing protein [Leptospira soteropolitanensis]
MCKTIQQKVKFKAPPITIYQFIADSKKVTALTGETALISKEIGGSFYTMSGKVSGIIVDLKPSVRIVQAWRRNDFPEGIFSMASFTFKQTSEGGTEVVLTHRGVPKELIPGIEESWRQNYWEKIRNAIKTLG